MTHAEQGHSLGVRTGGNWNSRRQKGVRKKKNSRVGHAGAWRAESVEAEAPDRTGTLQEEGGQKALTRGSAAMQRSGGAEAPVPRVHPRRLRPLGPHV